LLRRPDLSIHGFTPQVKKGVDNPLTLLYVAIVTERSTMPKVAMMQTRLTKKEEQGQESRRRILSEASALMAERGFAGTSISAVSERSGLPASSIYWHFESKEGLLGAVVEEGARLWFATLPKAEDLPPDPQQGIDALLDATAASLEKQPEFLRLLLLIALERGETDTASLDAIRRVRERAREHIEGIIASWLQPAGKHRAARLARELSVFTLALGDGVFIQNHIDPAGTNIRRLLEVLHRAVTALARELFDGPDQPTSGRATRKLKAR
jgi:AcrR family transcriptional regulator